MKVALAQEVPGSWTVRLRFTAAPGGEYLFAQNAYLRGQITAEVFEFVPAAMYLGILVQRGAIQENELLWLDGGESVESVVDLSADYAVDEHPLAGTRVRYRSLHPVFGVGPAAEERELDAARAGGEALWAVSGWLELR